MADDLGWEPMTRGEQGRNENAFVNAVSNGFQSDGEGRGINFSQSVAIELSRHMVVTARDGNERSVARNLLGNALFEVGRARERDGAAGGGGGGVSRGAGGADARAFAA